MKRNKLFIAGLVTVFVALVSLTLVSSTWAKYTSNATGSDTARVASWEWKLNDKELHEAVSFDLFTTVKDTNGTGNEKDVNSTLIAPGVQGSFAINLSNASEVTSKLTVTLSAEETSAGSHDIPIQYADNAEFTGATSDLASLGWNETVKAGQAPATASKTIYWRWVYNGDTDLDNK